MATTKMMRFAVRINGDADKRSVMEAVAHVKGVDKIQVDERSQRVIVYGRAEPDELLRKLKKVDSGATIREVQTYNDKQVASIRPQQGASKKPQQGASKRPQNKEVVHLMKAEAKKYEGAADKRQIEIRKQEVIIRNKEVILRKEERKVVEERMKNKGKEAMRVDWQSSSKPKATGIRLIKY